VTGSAMVSGAPHSVGAIQGVTATLTGVLQGTTLFSLGTSELPA
jgi:hypothetical protein